MKIILLLAAFALTGLPAAAQSTPSDCPEGYTSCGNACCPR